MSILIMILWILGALWMLLAAIAAWRLPDPYLRLQASTKGLTLGLTLLGLAVILHFQQLAATLLCGATVLFFALTAPIAAHMLARAAWRTGLRPMGRHEEAPLEES